MTSLSGEDLVSGVPAIKKIAQIQVEQISNIPSDDGRDANVNASATARWKPKEEHN